MLRDQKASSYISGMGLHWYANDISKHALIQDTASKFPDKFILGTEACEGEVLLNVYDVRL
jgi:glucosylceramidase